MNRNDLKQHLTEFISQRFKYWFKLYLSAMSNKRTVMTLTINETTGVDLNNIDDKKLLGPIVNEVNVQMDGICDYYFELAGDFFTYEELNKLKIISMKMVIKEKEARKINNKKKQTKSKISARKRRK